MGQGTEISRSAAGAPKTPLAVIADLLWFGMKPEVRRVALAVIFVLTGACAASLLFALSRPLGADQVALFKDVTPKPDDALLVGIFSGATIIVMAGCAGIALFAWAMARRFALFDERVRFLGWGGLWLTYAVSDDALMLHERIFPALLGTSQELALGLTALAALAIALAHFRVIAAHGGLLIGAAAVPAIGISLLSDAHVFPASWWYIELLEEAGEIFATLAWGALLAIIAREVMLDALSRARPTRA